MATSSREGQTIGGQYRIVEELGAGGMGAIFYAVHMLTEQPVAIKMLHPSLLGDEVVRKRFLSEASVLARMEHPNIVQWKNSFEDETGLYIVMQYVQGDNVESRLQARGGALPLEEAIGITAQTLAGLAYVHSKGVVHRDLKPSNILLTKEEEVKLADFGIARLSGTNRFTKEGMTIGTFFYMSPEQILGRDSDHRADIYSMGITLFEMVTGRMPFEGETEFDVCKQHLESPLPSIRKYTKELPKKLDAVLTKATAKKPEDRFQSAEEFLAALEINFPEAYSKAAPSRTGASLSKSEVSKLIQEYHGKPKRMGCVGMFLRLLLVVGLIAGLIYLFVFVLDSEEKVPTKRGEVPSHQGKNKVVKAGLTQGADQPVLTPMKITPKTPFMSRFQKNVGLWPTGERYGAALAIGKGEYSVKTSPGKGQSTLCPGRVDPLSGDVAVSMSSVMQDKDTKDRAVHGLALFFHKHNKRSQGYYIALDPPQKKIALARLQEGKWTFLQPWKVHPALAADKPNTLSAKVNGETIAVMINQKPAFSVKDSQYRKGQTCIFVQRGGTAIRFRTFSLARAL